MKKGLLFLLFLPLIVSCNPSNNSISSSESKKSISEILESYYSSSITLHSDVLFYYYYNSDPDNKITLQNYDVYAKYTENRFEFVSYIKGADYIYSSFYLQKEETGVVTYKSLNLNNEVVSQIAFNSDNSPLSWEDSIYRNDLMTYISADDLTLYDGNTYKLTKENASEWLEDVAASATDTSNLSADLIEGGYFTFEDDSMTLTIQEIESDEVYENCMYGRTITIKFENVGSTVIDDFKPLKEKEENEPLTKAIDKMKEATNYSYSLKGVVNNKEYDFEETQVFNNDIYTKSLNVENNSYIYEGYHTYSGLLYSFSTDDPNSMIGVRTDLTISDVKPSFNFSSALFNYVETDENGIKRYDIYEYPTVIDYITTNSSLSGSYSNANGDPISFYVNSNNSIDRIEIPANIVEISSSGEMTATYGYYKLTYSNIGTTTDTSVFSKFIIDDDVPEITSWDSAALNFTSTTKKEYTNPSDVFLALLGSKTAIPYFLPKSIKDYSEVTYESLSVFIYANTDATDEEITTIGTILTNDGFTYDEINAIYTKSFLENNYSVDISIMNESGFSAEIYFYKLI